MSLIKCFDAILVAIVMFDSMVYLFMMYIQSSLEKLLNVLKLMDCVFTTLGIPVLR